MNKKKVLIIVLVVLIVAAISLAAFMMIPKKDSKAPEPPAEQEVEAPDIYEVDGAAVQAFPVGPGIRVMLQRADKLQEQSTEITGTTPENSEPENTVPTDAVHVQAIYAYQGVSEVWERVADYCKVLMREDIGFVPVDAGNVQMELPQIEQSGRVRLAHPEEAGEGEEKQQWTFSLQLDWAGEGLNVVVAKVGGSIQQPPASEKADSNKKEPVTVAEAMNIFYGCKPSELNLEGDSMEAYDVIMLDGSVMVGKESCMRVNIYDKRNENNTNVIVGMYLLSSTGEKMYRVDLNDCIYPLSFTRK